MIFSKELEKLARETYHGSDLQRTAFKRGAAALENLILKSGEKINEHDICSAFDKKGFPDKTDFIAFDDGARWQHQRDQLIIAALRERIKELEK